MPDINYPTLKTVQLPQIAIQFSKLTPQMADTKLFADRFDKIIAANKEANKARSAYNQALGKVSAALNPADANWFKENIEDKALKEIQDIASSGYYGDLNNRITTLAGELANNKGLIGRMAANAEYNNILTKQQDRLKRGEIDQLAYDRWLEENPYAYNPSTASDGSELVGKLADLKPLQNTIDFQTIFERAAKDVEYEQYSYEGGGPDTLLRDIEKAKTTNHPTAADVPLASGQSTAATPTIIGYNKSGYHYTRKRAERIIANVRQLLKDPTINLQLQQKFDDIVWQLKKMQKEYDNLSYNDPRKQKLANEIKQYKNSTLKYNNNYLSSNDFESWVAMNIENSEYAKNLSFNRTGSSNYYTESYLNDGGSGSGRGTYNGGYDPDYIPEDDIIVPAPQLNKGDNNGIDWKAAGAAILQGVVNGFYRAIKE